MGCSRRRQETSLIQAPSSSTDRIERQLACAFRQIAQGVEIRSRQLGRDHGVTGPQLACLQAIVEYEPTTATDISTHVHLSPSTVVGILDRLEAKGLITRNRDKVDRRVVFVRATDAGRDLVARAPEPLSCAFRELLQDLSPADQQTLMSVASKLAELVDRKESCG